MNIVDVTVVLHVNFLIKLNISNIFLYIFLIYTQKQNTHVC